jgi:hypothetical protein
MATSTKSYYESLTTDAINADLQLLSIADDNDFFDLVSTNPMHYISILEHSPTKIENSPFKIRRVLNNLFVKFQMGIPPRTVDIGFMDNNTTDKETLEELKVSINLWKSYTNDEMSNLRRGIARIGCDESEPLNMSDIINSTERSCKSDVNKSNVSTSTRIPLPDYSFPEIPEKERVKAGYEPKTNMPKKPEYLNFNTPPIKEKNSVPSAPAPATSESNPPPPPPPFQRESVHTNSNVNANSQSQFNSNVVSTTTSSYVKNGYLYLITTIVHEINLDS